MKSKMREMEIGIREGSKDRNEWKRMRRKT